MLDQSVNYFYRHFMFNIDAITQDKMFLLDIAATLLTFLSPDVQEFLVSEGVQIPARLTRKTNHQGNQKLLLVKDAAVEADKNNRTIKAAFQTVVIVHNPRSFMEMPRGIFSIQMSGLGV